MPSYLNLRDQAESRSALIIKVPDIVSFVETYFNSASVLSSGCLQHSSFVLAIFVFESATGTNGGQLNLNLYSHSHDKSPLPSQHSLTDVP